jgi:hypothetical protein
MNDDWQQKFEALIHEIDGVSEDMGVYPAAIKGYNDERDYEQRDGFKNGWNAAVMEYGQKFGEAVSRASKGMDEDTILLLNSGHVIKTGDELLLVQNDTWGWAYAYCRPVKPEQVKEVARLFRSYGLPGLLYWETQQPDGETQSEFKDVNRFVAFVKAEEELRERVPDSNKRAYMDL